ncbi:hypothetical protein [Shewanella sp. 125m-1]
MTFIVQLAFISGSVETINVISKPAVIKPLTGTATKLEPMYPLMGTELVNEAGTVNKTQPVNVTQTSTKKEGGK